MALFPQKYSFIHCIFQYHVYYIEMYILYIEMYIARRSADRPRRAAKKRLRKFMLFASRSSRSSYVFFVAKDLAEER